MLLGIEYKFAVANFVTVTVVLWNVHGPGQHSVSHPILEQSLGINRDQGVLAKDSLELSILLWKIRKLKDTDSGHFVPGDLTSRDIHWNFLVST